MATIKIIKNNPPPVYKKIAIYKKAYKIIKKYCNYKKYML